VRITSPAHPIQPTTAEHIDAAGDAADASGIASIAWKATAGANIEASGAGSGTTQWTAASIPLRIGNNRIVVTATSGAGATNQDAVDVVRAPIVLPPE